MSSASLSKPAPSSGQGAMSYARFPTALDTMLLTYVVDNWKLIEELTNKMIVISFKIEKVERSGQINRQIRTNLPQ